MRTGVKIPAQRGTGDYRAGSGYENWAGLKSCPNLSRSLPGHAQTTLPIMILNAAARELCAGQLPDAWHTSLKITSDAPGDTKTALQACGLHFRNEADRV